MGMPSAIANYNKLNYYDVSPKIVRTGETTKITIKTKYVTKYPQFKLENKFFVLISPVLDFHIDAKGEVKIEINVAPTKSKNQITNQFISGINLSLCSNATNTLDFP